MQNGFVFVLVYPCSGLPVFWIYLSDDWSWLAL